MELLSKVCTEIYAMKTSGLPKVEIFGRGRRFLILHLRLWPPKFYSKWLARPSVDRRLWWYCLRSGKIYMYIPEKRVHDCGKFIYLILLLMFRSSIMGGKNFHWESEVWFKTYGQICSQYAWKWSGWKRTFDRFVQETWKFFFLTHIQLCVAKSC